jgi:hypothetical protein
MYMYLLFGPFFLHLRVPPYLVEYKINTPSNELSAWCELHVLACKKLGFE